MSVSPNLSQDDIIREFPLINQQHGNPRMGQRYKVVEAGDETFHVYVDGQVERLTEKTPDVPDVTLPLPPPTNTLISPEPPTPSPVITTPLPVSPPVTSDPALAAAQARIIELEAQAAAKANTSASALSVPLNASHPDITLGQLEPGLVWGIRQGLFKAEDVGAHISVLLDMEAK